MSSSLADWSSVIQLLCAHTLLIRGYVEYTEGTQDKAEKMLDEVQAQLEAACKNIPVNGEVLREIEQFEWIEWNKTSPHMLNRHRRHLTTWFWNRRMNLRRVESRRNSFLVAIGSISLALLLASACAGSLPVPTSVGLGLSLLMWVFVIDIMVSTWLDDRELRALIQRSEGNISQEPSFIPFEGMIYAVCNEVRRKYGRGYNPSQQGTPAPPSNSRRRRRRKKSPDVTTNEPSNKIN